MKQLTESQKDLFNVFIPVALFWVVMTFFISTAPNYLKQEKAPQIENKRAQSPTLDKYGELFLKHSPCR
jgi:hypothetical protein